jgi:hypothetical protein
MSASIIKEYVNARAKWMLVSYKDYAILIKESN